MKIAPDKRQLLLQVSGFDFELCCCEFFKPNQKYVFFSRNISAWLCSFRFWVSFPKTDKIFWLKLSFTVERTQGHGKFQDLKP